MCKIQNNIFIVAILMHLYPSGAVATQDITPEMKANAESIIQTCESRYQKIKQDRSKLDSIKKPSLMASKKDKEFYKKIEIDKKAFDMQFAEFVKFTNEKIGIRTAKNSTKLRDSAAAYSSNCTRFADGLEGFITWAMTDKSPKGYEIIYKGWHEEAKKQLEK